MKPYVNFKFLLVRVIWLYSFQIIGWLKPVMFLCDLNCVDYVGAYKIYDRNVLIFLQI